MPNPGFAQRLPLPGRALALVLAGGRGSRGVDTDSRTGAATADGHNDAERAAAYPLHPAPPAHFGGKFRTVDFALSNCLNSGIRRVVVLAPSSGHSLQRHLARSWNFLKGDESEFVRTIRTEPGAAAAQRELILRSGAEFVVVLSGDRIYKMNCAALLADHVAKGRPCTVACTEASPGAGANAATLAVDEHGRITAGAAGQGAAAAAQPVAAAAPPAAPAAAPARHLQRLGVCVFSSAYLLAELDRLCAEAGVAAPGPANTSLGLGAALADGAFAGALRAVLACAVQRGQASAHHFADSCVGAVAGAAPYWRDVGTLDAYWHAHIELTARTPQLDLYDPNWPMRAQHAELAPAKFLHNQVDRRGMAVESLVSGGSIISGAVLRSVLFSSVRVHSYAQVEWSVLLPSVQVGRHARLKRVVVDSACSIPEGLVVGEDPVADAARFYRSADGITFVTAEMINRLRSGPHRLHHPPQPCTVT